MDDLFFWIHWMNHPEEFCFSIQPTKSDLNSPLNPTKHNYASDKSVQRGIELNTCKRLSFFSGSLWKEMKFSNERYSNMTSQSCQQEMTERNNYVGSSLRTTFWFPMYSYIHIIYILSISEMISVLINILK